MTVPDSGSIELNAMVAALGNRLPTEHQAISITQHILVRLSGEYPQVRPLVAAAQTNRLVLALSLARYVGDYLDRDGALVKKFRNEFPKGEVFDVGLPAADGCVFRLIFLIENHLEKQLPVGNRYLSLRNSMRSNCLTT